MKVKLAHIAGFCMGVREAMDLTLEVTSDSDGPIYTYGPLIHNPSALRLLEKKGVKVLREVPREGNGTVIIRAHGVAPEEKERLRDAGFLVIDGTCPRVIKVQSICSHYAQKGYTCVVIGDEGHPEVKGILGHAQDKGVLVSKEGDISTLSLKGPYIIVAQTTQDRERFQDWANRILERFPEGRIFDTVCDSTKRRQEEVRRLSGEVDAVIVVGGKKSANSRRLAEIVREEGKPVFFVETEEDVDPEKLRGYGTIGVTAGASTPNWVINGVLRKVESIPGRDESLLKRAFMRVLRFLHESNLWTGLGGAALSLGAEIMLAQGIDPRFPLMAFLFVFSMHTLARLMDSESGKYNDPLRTAFLTRYKWTFYTASVLGLVASLAIGAWIGQMVFWPILFVILAAFLYTLTGLKAIPGSKTIFIALAWVTVTVFCQCLYRGQVLGNGAILSALFVPQCITVLFFSFFLVFMRDGLMEIIDVQGDRIVGRETLTVLMGEETMLKLMQWGGAIMTVLTLPVPIFIRGFWPVFLAFTLAFIYSCYLVRLFERTRLGKNLRLELLVEAMTMVFCVFSLVLKVLFYL